MYHHPLKGDVVSVDKNVTNFNRSFLEARCDVHHLPFRDKIFDVVYASHILEHVFNPLAFLKETKRVAKRGVIVRVPNLLFPDQIESKNHLFSWSKDSLRNLLSLVFDKVEILHSMHYDFPHLPIVKRLGIFFINYLVSNIIKEVEIVAICRLGNTDMNGPGEEFPTESIDR